MDEAHSSNPRGRPKSLDRQLVVEAAMLTYWRNDLGSLSLNEVSRRVGMSKPALYREFGGEDGLLAAVLERYHALAIEPLLALLHHDRPFYETLRDLLASMAAAPDDRPPGCLYAKMRLARWRLSKASSEGVDAIRDEVRAAYAAWYGRAVARGGEVDPTVPPERAAIFIDTQLTAAVIQLGVGRTAADVRADTLRAFRGLLAS